MEVLMFALGTMTVPVFAIGYLTMFMGGGSQEGKNILTKKLVLSFVVGTVGLFLTGIRTDREFGLIEDFFGILLLSGIVWSIVFTTKTVRKHSSGSKQCMTATKDQPPEVFAREGTKTEIYQPERSGFNNNLFGAVEEKRQPRIIENEMYYVDRMVGETFEEYVGDILRGCGYHNVSTTAVTGDYGVDITAEKDFVKYAIQCKRWEGNVGVHAVQEVYSGREYYKANIAMVITNSFFTPNAKQMADRLGVVLIDREKLMAMIEAANKKERGGFYDLDQMRRPLT